MHVEILLSFTMHSNVFVLFAFVSSFSQTSFIAFFGSIYSRMFKCRMRRCESYEVWIVVVILYLSEFMNESSNLFVVYMDASVMCECCCCCFVYVRLQFVNNIHIQIWLRLLSSIQYDKQPHKHDPQRTHKLKRIQQRRQAKPTNKQNKTMNLCFVVWVFNVSKQNRYKEHYVTLNTLFRILAIFIDAEFFRNCLFVYSRNFCLRMRFSL